MGIRRMGVDDSRQFIQSARAVRLAGAEDRQYTREIRAELRVAEVI
jgi:hypothetical protein